MINDIVNHVKAKLGATHRRLELEDAQIVELLQRETLMTLSAYSPFFLEYRLPLTADNTVEGMANTYHLPDELGGFRVVGVEKVVNSVGLTSPGDAQFGILGADMGQMMGAYADTKLLNGMTTAMMAPQTFQYIHPGLLRIHNNYESGSVLVVMKTTHRKDFGTVPFGMRETVFRLALADVASDLLGIRSYFTQVGTTFAEINLNLDLLQGWVSSRDDLVESLRKNQLKVSGVRKIYLA